MRRILPPWLSSKIFFVVFFLFFSKSFYILLVRYCISDVEGLEYAYYICEIETASCYVRVLLRTHQISSHKIGKLTIVRSACIFCELVAITVLSVYKHEFLTRTFSLKAKCFESLYSPKALQNYQLKSGDKYCMSKQQYKPY